MSVYKRGKTYWYRFVWRSQEIRESTKQGNATVARQMEAARRTQLAKGEVGIRDRGSIPTLSEFAARFTAAIETQCADKPATVGFYKEKLDRLLSSENLAATHLDGIDEAAIEAYTQLRKRAISRRGMPPAVASINRELATLRRLLRLAQEWKILDRVPRVRLLRGEKNREFVVGYDLEELYLATAPDDLRDVSTLLLDAGLRVGEALSLEWPEVRLTPAAGAKFGYLTIGRTKSKNSKKRNVPLTERAVEMLRRRGPQRGGYVFQRADGLPLYQTWLNQQHSALRATLKQSADFVLHTFRHTYGTRLGESGADAFTIMRLMGHSSVTVSQKYVHPSPESMENAVERLQALNRSKSAKSVEVGTNPGTPSHENEPKTKLSN